MALTMYMKVTGKNQGEIKGSCDQGGDKKDKILVYAMDHKVEIPKDTHTGQRTLTPDCQPASASIIR